MVASWRSTGQFPSALLCKHFGVTIRGALSEARSDVVVGLIAAMRLAGFDAHLALTTGR